MLAVGLAFENSAKKFAVVTLSSSASLTPFHLRQNLGGMAHERRLVPLAAVRMRARNGASVSTSSRSSGSVAASSRKAPNFGNVKIPENET